MAEAAAMNEAEKAAPDTLPGADLDGIVTVDWEDLEPVAPMVLDDVPDTIPGASLAPTGVTRHC